MLIIIFFGLLENIIMKQHAIFYHFDRLKFLPIFSLAIPVIFQYKNTLIRSGVFFIILCGSIYSVYEYQNLRIKENSALTYNNFFVKQADFQEDCSSCTLGIKWAVRGYTNLLLNKGVHEGQTPNSLAKLAVSESNCSCFIYSDSIGESIIKINGYKKFKGK